MVVREAGKQNLRAIAMKVDPLVYESVDNEDQPIQRQREPQACKDEWREDWGGHKGVRVVEGRGYAEERVDATSRPPRGCRHAQPSRRQCVSDRACLGFANETDRRKQLGYGRKKGGYIWVEACRGSGNEAVV